MKFQKGQSGNPDGRPKGIPNKLTATLKECIEEAFYEVGGVEYLKRMADEDRKAFAALLGRVLPKDVTLGSDPNSPPRLVVEIIDPTRPPKS